MKTFSSFFFFSGNKCHALGLVTRQENHSIYNLQIADHIHLNFDYTLKNWWSFHTLSCCSVWNHLFFYTSVRLPSLTKIPTLYDSVLCFTYFFVWEVISDPNTVFETMVWSTYRIQQIKGSKKVCSTDIFILKGHIRLYRKNKTTHFCIYYFYLQEPGKDCTCDHVL